MRGMVQTAGAVAICLMAAACVPTDPYAGGVPPSQGGINQCGALDLQYLVGAPARDLDAMQFNKPVRVIYPGTAVTMDFSRSRCIAPSATTSGHRPATTGTAAPPGAYRR